MTLITGSERRFKSSYTRGPQKGGMGACSKCPKSVQLMCEDRCAAGRAVLCEFQTPEERELEYAFTQQTRL